MAREPAAGGVPAAACEKVGIHPVFSGYARRSGCLGQYPGYGDTVSVKRAGG